MAKLQGGTRIYGTANVDSSMSVGGTLYATGSVASTSNLTGTIVVTGGLGVTGNINSSGTISAISKSFLIEHPTKPGMKLRYGSLEGPENGVYVRGKLTEGNTISLPEYWLKLVDPETITVDLTPIGKHQKLFIREITNNKIIVGNDELFTNSVNCFYTVYGERCDVEKLKVEC